MDRSLWRWLKAYWGVSASAALVTALALGWQQALVIAAAGVAVALPASFFGLWLVVRGRFARGGVSFLVAEAVKVLGVLFLMVAFAGLLTRAGIMDWPIFVLGLAFAAKAPLVEVGVMSLVKEVTWRLQRGQRRLST